MTPGGNLMKKEQKFYEEVDENNNKSYKVFVEYNMVTPEEQELMYEHYHEKEGLKNHQNFNIRTDECPQPEPPAEIPLLPPRPIEGPDNPYSRGYKVENMQLPRDSLGRVYIPGQPGPANFNSGKSSPFYAQNQLYPQQGRLTPTSSFHSGHSQQPQYNPFNQLSQQTNNRLVPGASPNPSTHSFSQINLQNQPGQINNNFYSVDPQQKERVNIDGHIYEGYYQYDENGEAFFVVDTDCFKYKQPQEILRDSQNYSPAVRQY